MTSRLARRAPPRRIRPLRTLRTRWTTTACSSAASDDPLSAFRLQLDRSMSCTPCTASISARSEAAHSRRARFRSEAVRRPSFRRCSTRAAPRRRAEWDGRRIVRCRQRRVRAAETGAGECPPAAAYLGSCRAVERGPGRSRPPFHPECFSTMSRRSMYLSRPAVIVSKIATPRGNPRQREARHVPAGAV